MQGKKGKPGLNKEDATSEKVKPLHSSCSDVNIPFIIMEVHNKFTNFHQMDVNDALVKALAVKCHDTHNR